MAQHRKAEAQPDEPVDAAGRAGGRRHRRAVDPGRGPEHVWSGRVWEDDDRAWGDSTPDDDERILRERPPHWQ